MGRHGPDGVLTGRYFRTAASRARADEGFPVTCHHVEPGGNGSNADRGHCAGAACGPVPGAGRRRRGRGHNPDAVRIVIGKLRASSGSMRHPWNTHRRFYWTFGLTLTPWTGCPESRVRERARRWRRTRRPRMFDFSRSRSRMPFSVPLRANARPRSSCSP